MWSDAGGAVAPRPVRVRYRFPRWDSPGRVGRDGVVLLVFTIVTIARTTETFHGVESGDPFDLYYLGIDNGTSDWYIGWEVPKAVYEDLPDGTPVEAVVSGDGRYLYRIRTLHR